MRGLQKCDACRKDRDVLVNVKCKDKSKGKKSICFSCLSSLFDKSNSDRIKKA